MRALRSRGGSSQAAACQSRQQRGSSAALRADRRVKECEDAVQRVGVAALRNGECRQSQSLSAVGDLSHAAGSLAAARLIVSPPPRWLAATAPTLLGEPSAAAGCGE